MPFGTPREPQYATQCRYLRVTMGKATNGGLVNLCQHIIREGSLCVGPFLDETETNCQLWELHPRFEGKTASPSTAR